MFVLTTLISQEAVRTHNATVTSRSTNGISEGVRVPNSPTVHFGYWDLFTRTLCGKTARFLTGMHQKTLCKQLTYRVSTCKLSHYIIKTPPGNFWHRANWLLVIHFSCSWRSGLWELLFLCVNFLVVCFARNPYQGRVLSHTWACLRRGWLCSVTAKGCQLQGPKLYRRNIGSCHRNPSIFSRQEFEWEETKSSLMAWMPRQIDQHWETL